MKNKFNTLLLIVVCIIGVILRFVGLSDNPPSLTWDEAAWGYNSYSLGIDGKDEFGRFLPVDYLESFGDFKPPVYAYLGILPVKIFGLTEFATRFPSAFFGSLTILATYFLIKRIFFKSVHSEAYALITAGILAISPWHILLSRAAFEANVATFFIVAGILFFLGGIQGKKWYFSVSAVFFVLSLYTFNTARIVSPLLVLVLGIVFWRKLFLLKKYTMLVVVIGVVLTLPTVPFLLSPQAKLRYQEVNIFSDIKVIERVNQHIENDNKAWWSKIIHNRRFAYGVEYAKHYLDHFTPQFLFIKGDGNPKFSTQVVGQMYLWELPFFVMGILLLFKKREGYWWIIPMWLLLGIIPAATARETPHALRIATTIPTFQLFTAYGLMWATILLGRHKKYLVGAVTIIAILSLTYFLHNYINHYPYNYSGEWQYGYRESIRYVNEIGDEYDQIVVTTELGRPYSYYLFYTKTHPEDFRKSAQIRRSPFGFVDIDGYGKYRFTQDLHTNDNTDGKLLYVNLAEKTPSNANILRTVNQLNGKPVLSIYTL